MKPNGVVRRVAASPPGLERWEAQCLLCSWRSGGRRLLRLQRRGRAGDWDALEHVSRVEPEEASGRGALPTSHQASCSVPARDSPQKNPLSNFVFIDASGAFFFAPPIVSSSSPTAAFYLPG